MAISDMPPVGRSTACNIYANGVISFSQSVIHQVNWRIGQAIIPSFLHESGLLILLFRMTDAEHKGFKLSYLNRNGSGGSGGKLSCKRLATKVILPNVALPIRDIPPIFLNLDNKSEHKPYQLALILRSPEWIDVEFNATGADRVSSRLLGVYKITNSNPQKPLKIGQGWVQSRLKENLKENDLRVGRRLQYFPLSRKSDAELIEHIFLMQYKQENNGQLPPGNRITA